jgi:hypothetical protein
LDNLQHIKKQAKQMKLPNGIPKLSANGDNHPRTQVYPQ